MRAATDVSRHGVEHSVRLEWIGSDVELVGSERSLPRAPVRSDGD
jgi:hypothetical protein